MKVCTDACLFGALTVQKIRHQTSNIRNVLDIGTGTGLLSLMVAQKNPDAIIDAVEIDEDAAQQAKENFESSPWRGKLHVHHTSIQQLLHLTNQPINQLTSKPINQPTNQPIHQSTKYDFIICNPPFFENDLKSKNVKRNLALHSLELSLEELLDAVNKLLANEGIFSVLLPHHRTQLCINLAIQQSLYLSKKVLVKQTPQHNYFRSMLWFTRQSELTEESEIIIQNEEGRYTEKFIELLKDYYLHL